VAITSEDSKNYKITQGDTFNLEIQYVDPDNNPISLEGFTFLMEIKDKPGGSILCASCTIGDGINITDSVNGIFTVTVSPQKTKSFNYPKSAYQIQITDQYNQKYTLLQGWFNVNAGVIN
jgi:hypothetical protein